MKKCKTKANAISFASVAHLSYWLLSSFARQKVPRDHLVQSSDGLLRFGVKMTI